MKADWDVVEPGSTGGMPHPRAPLSRRVYALILLAIIYTLNQIDRQIIAVLAEPIKHELALSDTELGFLTGIAFALLYSISGIPIAYVADRVNRRNLVALALGVWSLMTAVCGLAQSFAQLAVARLLVGVGEAGCSPPAHSMISDLFGKTHRARALAIYALGIPIGSLGGLLIGGILNDLYGWRSALFIVAIPGLVLALLLRLTIAEPRRGASEEIAAAHAAAPSFREAFRYLWARPTYRHLLIGGAVVAAIATNNVVWTPPFMVRSHGMSLRAIGLELGLVSGAAGAIGILLGGYLADRLGPRDPRWRLWIAAVAMAFICPFSVFAFLAEDPRVCLALLSIPILLSSIYAPAAFAAVQGIATVQMRASAAALLLAVGSLLGYGGGPQVVGILSDLLAPSAGKEALRYSMALFSLTGFWGAWHYYRAGASLPIDMARVDR